MYYIGWYTLVATTTECRLITGNIWFDRKSGVDYSYPAIDFARVCTMMFDGVFVCGCLCVREKSNKIINKAVFEVKCYHSFSCTYRL